MPDNSIGDFTYVDLFAGIGGFAAALSDLGGRCVDSVEIDPRAAAVYERNHGTRPKGDITQFANEERVDIAAHDVLTAGFPCQPFSKSGAQRGMDEARGTLFWNILRVIEKHHPAVVILENVRNLAGPKHRHEWEVIIRSLRDQGYHVSSTPAIFSPHLLPTELGGRPQIRERVFITATYWPEKARLDPPPVVTNTMIRTREWNLLEELDFDSRRYIPGCELTLDEARWIDAWDDFREIAIAGLRSRVPAKQLDSIRLPGFPIWVDSWVHEDELIIPQGTPRWKETFLRKNAAFYTAHRSALDAWIARHDVTSFPPSRRKFEWQAQQDRSLWQCVIQLRPSGIRVKRPTHLPALVAISQTPIIGELRRKLSPREAAELQGLPPTFDFGDQPIAATYKQLGNGVNVGVVKYVLAKHILRDIERLAKIAPGITPIANAYSVDSAREPVLV
ncbi:DNA (cytosine-5-)-methyltransferase [Occultella kanbiaonis]|uniref:DNA (cytosine-5-)-methyltransferase n=1 Tax=Occultella kanbiaonis TaxID=2675754 RepID=UPI0012B8D13A|nr:DNA (cytosine-5-)-methyltransferase [Occultella kanbiaonis]